MQLSKQSVETLVDLVENKLSTMEIWDRADKREVNMLRKCLRELTAQPAGKSGMNGATGQNGGADGARRRGRPPKHLEPISEAAQ